MAQAGYTPISLYYSTTAAAVPTAGNLVAGELAINIVDGKLYYENSSGVVTLLASSTTVTNSFSAGTTGFTPSTATTGAVTLGGTLITSNGGTGLASYTAGDLSYYASGTALTKLAIGTAGQILTSSGTAPQWSTLSGVAVTTFSAGTTGFTPSSATSGAVTLAGTLATTNGGTGLTSFTSGGVVYASSSSALATGSALTFDGTTLGVNNGVAGGTAVSLTGTYSGSGSVNFLTFQRAGGAVAGALRYSDDNPFGMMFGTTTSHAQIFMTANTERMRISNAGDVGIGTSSPSAKFQVNRSTTGTSAVFSAIDGTYDTAFQISHGATGVTLTNSNPYSGAYNNLIFANSGAGETARIDSSGNLQVGGNSSYGGIRTVIAGAGVTPSTGAGAYNIVASLYDTGAGVTAAGGGLGFQGNDGVNSAVMFASINGAKENSTSGNYASYLGFATRANGGSLTEKLRISSAGNVGIGSGSPDTFLSGTAKLTVYANVNSQHTAFVRNDNAGSSASSALALNAFGNTWGIEIGSAAKNGNALTFQLDYNGTNATKMTLDSAGNLGLGVTPSAWGGSRKALQVGSATSLFDDASGSAALSANAYYDGSVYKYLVGTGASAYIQSIGSHAWYSAASGSAGANISFTTAMTLDASGNLMVGATSTSAIANKNIDVNGTGDAAFVVRVGGTSTSYLYSTAGTAILGTVSTIPLAFNTNNTERARITSSGDVQISTSKNDDTTLYVQNGNAGTASTARFDLRDSSSHYLTMRAYGQNATGTTFGISNAKLSAIFDNSSAAESSGLVIGTSPAMPLMFGTNSTERARIDSSGNFIVGATSVNYAGSGFTLSTDSGTTKWLVGPITGTAGNFYIASSGTTGVYLNGTSATSWSSNSDFNLKTDLIAIENAAEKVASLRAVTGRYKTDPEGTSRAFLIAQDVQAVLPEAVAPTTMYDGTEVLGLAYTETIPLLVAAIKEQQAIIESLKARLDAANL